MPLDAATIRRCMRISAPLVTISQLETLQDLQTTIRAREVNNHLKGMLESTLSHICQCLGEPPHKIRIGRLLYVKPDLQAHLKKWAKRNTVRSYTHYLGILIKKAKELGWCESSPEIVRSWQPVFDALVKVHGAAGVVRWAIREGKRSHTFTYKDLDEWGDNAVRGGLSLKYVLIVKHRFRRGVLERGLGGKFPEFSPPKTGRVYGVPLARFPVSLRIEVENLVKWKTAEYSPGRAQCARNRPISAHNLCCLISRIAGHIVNIRGKSLSNLSELLGEESVTGYIEWAITQRGLNARALRVDLARIWGLESYPLFASRGFGWLQKLTNEMPESSEEEIRERKQYRWVPYSELEKVPLRIRQEAGSLAALDERRRPFMMRDALIIEWLTILPWRQRNLRECKVLPFAQGGNLFKEEVSAHSSMVKPEWVKRALEANQHERFWQFYFRAAETKTGCVVRAILPRQLVPVLEQYIEHYRTPILNGRHDPGTLFLTNWGCAPSATGFLQLVRNSTLRYTGRAVNPHLMRDILAVQWLEDHPEDFLTLSKILWHRNIKTTLRVYGAGFDESHAARRIEEWLEKRRR